MLAPIHLVMNYSGSLVGLIVTTPLKYRYAGRGNVRKQTSAIRLKELGPRISMSLVKVSVVPS